MRLTTSLLIALLPGVAAAAVYECPASRKVDSERTYTAAQIRKYQFSTRLEELPEGTFVSRCSFTPSEGKTTCDRYAVDRVETDPKIGVKKFYVFSAQFDLQVFVNLRSVENNGRGGIQFGICKLVAP